ncbi:MAG: DUF4422 domain-containing protein [Lachnospiraceae bacterium]|nr:DUF4422 domain-containing protein [Lachnospiraceae bacterium]
MDIKLIIAAHKPYTLPSDGVYLPVRVGAEGKAPIAGFSPDNTGDNISALNPYFCELTGLYWAWRNLDCDALGLVHYRRYFARRGAGDKRGRIFTRKDAEQALRRSPIVLPRKRRYYIETNYSQYVHAHHEQDLTVLRQVLSEMHPEALPAYDASMKRRSGHRFNMFIMKRKYADAWCEWLFGVLFEVQKRLDISAYSSYDARVFGFLAERLLDVWIAAEDLPYIEVPYVNLESQHWPRKIISFIGRKFSGKHRGDGTAT